MREYKPTLDYCSAHGFFYSLEFGSNFRNVVFRDGLPAASDNYIPDHTLEADSYYNYHSCLFTRSGNQEIVITLYSNFYMNSIRWFNEDSSYNDDTDLFEQKCWLSKIISLTTINYLAKEVEDRIHNIDPDDEELSDMSFLPMYYIEQKLVHR